MQENLRNKPEIEYINLALLFNITQAINFTANFAGHAHNKDAQTQSPIVALYSSINTIPQSWLFFIVMLINGVRR